ncbi:hypothetical protein ACVWWG_000350 [Bradyrhizobium sp. LB7.2]
MKILSAVIVASALAAGPAMAQQAAPNQNLQTETDKGVKTHNSGASGNVGSQESPGAAAHPPGQPGLGGAAAATSAHNSGAGISGAPGGKSGPPPGQGTVGSAGDPTVQQQDPTNIKGLPGNKSGPPVKR